MSHEQYEATVHALYSVARDRRKTDNEGLNGYLNLLEQTESELSNLTNSLTLQEHYYNVRQALITLIAQEYYPICRL